jgi:hypothetical protein
MNDQLRRSNRRQKVRGEKEYIVDSTMLLRDLKVKVIIKCWDNSSTGKTIPKLAI